jgi:hypothetical protein
MNGYPVGLIGEHGGFQTGLALDIDTGPGTIAQELTRLGSALLHKYG